MIKKSKTHNYVLGNRTNGHYYVYAIQRSSGRESMQDFAEYDKAMQYMLTNIKLDNK